MRNDYQFQQAQLVVFGLTDLVLTLQAVPLPHFHDIASGFLCVRTSMCMYKHMTVCVCGGQRLTSAVIPQVVSP